MLLSWKVANRYKFGTNLHVSYFGEAACHQLLDYLYYTLVELSSFAVGFHELMDSKNVNHLLVDCSEWPHIHFCYISIRYLIGPICGDSVLRNITSLSS